MIPEKMGFAIDRTKARTESDRQAISTFLFLQLSKSQLHSLLNRIVFRFSRCETRHETSDFKFDNNAPRTTRSCNSLDNKDPLLSTHTTQARLFARQRSPNDQQWLRSISPIPSRAANGDPQSAHMRSTFTHHGLQKAIESSDFIGSY